MLPIIVHVWPPSESGTIEQKEWLTGVTILSLALSQYPSLSGCITVLHQIGRLNPKYQAPNKVYTK